MAQEMKCCRGLFKLTSSGFSSIILSTSRGGSVNMLLAASRPKQDEMELNVLGSVQSRVHGDDRGGVLCDKGRVNHGPLELSSLAGEHNTKY